MPEEPKIVVDSDWKAQARAEKERLASTEKPAPAAPASGSAAGAKPAGVSEPVEATFEELVRLLATQTLLYLGAFPDPETGRSVVALDYAKLHVDLLGVLEQKTKGNLTASEQSMLTRVVHELRMQYVEVARAVAKAVEEGRVARAGVPPAAPPRPPAS